MSELSAPARRELHLRPGLAGALLGRKRALVRLSDNTLVPESTTQTWRVAYGPERAALVANVPFVSRKLIAMDGLGRYVYALIAREAPSRLFSVDRYALRFTPPGCRHTVVANLDDRAQLSRLFDEFARKRSKRAAVVVPVVLVSRVPGGAVLDARAPPKAREPLDTLPAVVSKLAEFYALGKIRVGELDRVMALKPDDVGRELHARLPRMEQTAHDYLVRSPPKPQGARIDAAQYV